MMTVVRTALVSLKAIDSVRLREVSRLEYCGELFVEPINIGVMSIMHLTYPPTADFFLPVA